MLEFFVKMTGVFFLGLILLGISFFFAFADAAAEEQVLLIQKQSNGDPAPSPASSNHLFDINTAPAITPNAASPAASTSLSSSVNNTDPISSQHVEHKSSPPPNEKKESANQNDDDDNNDDSVYGTEIADPTIPMDTDDDGNVPIVNKNNQTGSKPESSSVPAAKESTFVLNQILFSADRKLAMINGVLVSEGQKIDDHTMVAEIHADKVVIVNKSGAKKELSLIVDSIRKIHTDKSSTPSSSAKTKNIQTPTTSSGMSIERKAVSE